MKELFSAQEPQDAAYIYLRDKEKHAKRRLFCESMWQDFHSLADSGFVDEIGNKFQQRFWEMYLGCTLLKLGFQCRSADSGPDVEVFDGDTSLWVEAIAPTGGNGPDAAYDAPPGVATRVPEDEIILRLRGAVEEKHDKYLGYLENGIVKPGQPYVIAVNGRLIPSSETDDIPSYITKTLYPLGNHYGVINKNTMEIVETGIRHRPVITKRSGAPVYTTVFEDPAYAAISAVIYSRADAYNGPENLGCDFQLLHNPNASNPIPSEWLKVGRESWATETEIKEKDWGAE